VVADFRGHSDGTSSSTINALAYLGSDPEPNGIEAFYPTTYNCTARSNDARNNSYCGACNPIASGCGSALVSSGAG